MANPVSKSWVLWFAIILHLVWGVTLLVDERASWTTGINALVNFFPGAVATAIVLITVSLLSIYAIYRVKDPLVRLGLLFPQQMLLCVSAWGAIHAALTSSFADGVIRPSAFIFADQFPAILISVLHIFALIEHSIKPHLKQG